MLEREEELQQIEADLERRRAVLDERDARMTAAMDELQLHIADVERRERAAEETLEQQRKHDKRAQKLEKLKQVCWESLSSIHGLLMLCRILHNVSDYLHRKRQS